MSINNLKEKYPDGMTILELSHEAGISRAAVYLRLKELNIETKNLTLQKNRGAKQAIAVIEDFDIIEKLVEPKDPRGRLTNFVQFYIPGWQKKTKEELIRAIEALV